MKHLIDFIVAYKIIKICIGVILSVVILVYLFRNGLVDFIVETFKNL